MSFTDAAAKKIVEFLRDIGLTVVTERIEDETFLPGILIRNGRIVVDQRKLTYPGDLLHEAGHLALADSRTRAALNDEVVLPGVQMQPIEAQVMAWSYAAAIHLGLDPRVVFHDAGYFGNSEGLLLNFRMGAYIGVDGLQRAGLTVFGKAAEENGLPPYPQMIKWLRD
jgi:hypothetical protein